MSDWYCSSVAWMAVTAWSAGLTATTGMLRRQLATPTVGNERVWRCTTPGTTGGSEPSWTLTKASTTSDNGVVWTECTGDAGHQHDNGVTNTWTAPHARWENMLAWMTAPDRGFLSSDHTQTKAGGQTFAPPGSGQTLCSFFSVDRTTGNIPPIDTDLTYGAEIITTGGTLNRNGGGYYEKMRFQSGSGTDASQFAQICQASNLMIEDVDCHWALGGSGSGKFIHGGGSTFLKQTGCTWELNNTGHGYQTSGAFVDAFFKNMKFSGTSPANFFNIGGGGSGKFHIADTDFSAYGSSQSLFSQSGAGCYVTLRDCKLGSGMHRVVSDVFSTSNPDNYWLDVINCDTGGGTISNEWYRNAGTIVTEGTIKLTGGASDGTAGFSHKYTTQSTATYFLPLISKEGALYCGTTGVAKTITFELITSGVTLKNDEFWVEVEYLGTASSSEATLISSRVATRLTTAANIATSTSGWDSSPASPVKQAITLTFTPQQVGFVKWKCWMTKASTTVYMAPPKVLT